VNGAPFQIGLGRLLRKARPDRLFIEPSGLGHPAQLLKQLRGAVVGCAGGAALCGAGCPGAGRRESVAPAQQDALGSAGLLLLNKAEGLDEAVRQTIAERLPAVKLIWTQQAQLSLASCRV
jgi:G3E family GTPase